MATTRSVSARLKYFTAAMHALGLSKLRRDIPLQCKEITSISFSDLWERDKTFRILQECHHRVKCHVTGHGIEA